jgi:hypothetical protein
MKEVVIRQFFEGHATAEELTADAKGAFDRHTDSAGTVFSQLRAVPMERDFALTPAHLVKLIDAVLNGVIDLEAIDAIAFCIEASDKFMWDADTPPGERVAEALHLLGTPEINYPLSPVVLGKIRHYLITGEKTLNRGDLAPKRTRPHLISEKSWHRGPDV